MATWTRTRVQFDTDLPLFRVEVKDYIAEIFFQGPVNATRPWKVIFNDEVFAYQSLEACWSKIEKLLSELLNTEYKICYPKPE